MRVCNRSCYLLRLLPVTCLVTLTAAIPHITSLETRGSSSPHPHSRAENNANAAFNVKHQDNLVVYWGQAPGSSDSRLVDLCNEPSVDVVIIGFVRDFSGPGGYPRFDLGEECVYDPKNGGSPVPQCAGLAQDIALCQQMGKSILISMGGGSSDALSFPTAKSAIDAATLLWFAFVAPEASVDVAKPFPGVHVDGFDIDHENGSAEHFELFVRVLRSLTAPSKKRFIISASASCSGKDSLTPGTLRLMDFVSIRFYHAQKCEWGSEGFQQSLHTWCQFFVRLAISGSLDLYGAPRMYVGAMSFETKDGDSGYIEPDSFGEMLREAKVNSPFCFGGAMLWEGSMGLNTKTEGGTHYLDVAKNAMH